MFCLPPLKYHLNNKMESPKGTIDYDLDRKMSRPEIVNEMLKHGKYEAAESIIDAVLSGDDLNEKVLVLERLFEYFIDMEDYLSAYRLRILDFLEMKKEASFVVGKTIIKKKGDFKSAIKYLKKAAEEGHTEAKKFIGMAYYHQENYEDAVKYLYQAVIESDLFECYVLLIQCYLDDQKFEEALKVGAEALARGVEHVKVSMAIAHACLGQLNEALIYFVEYLDENGVNALTRAEYLTMLEVFSVCGDWKGVVRAMQKAGKRIPELNENSGFVYDGEGNLLNSQLKLH
ncbi:tetratricopeptide repeat protein [Candidatus Peregrinibacteria bacterium]|nr:tetratricopeptide repeat protein [Candidatus Peregrinibacteria bacterium]